MGQEEAHPAAGKGTAARNMTDCLPIPLIRKGIRSQATGAASAPDLGIGWQGIGLAVGMIQKHRRGREPRRGCITGRTGRGRNCGLQRYANRETIN